MYFQESVVHKNPIFFYFSCLNVNLYLYGNSQVVARNAQTRAKPLLKQCEQINRLTNSWLQKHQLNEIMHNKRVKCYFILCWGDMLWLPHIHDTHKAQLQISACRPTTNVHLAQELQLILNPKLLLNVILCVSVQHCNIEHFRWRYMLPSYVLL